MAILAYIIRNANLSVAQMHSMEMEQLRGEMAAECLSKPAKLLKISPIAMFSIELKLFSSFAVLLRSLWLELLSIRGILTTRKRKKS